MNISAPFIRRPVATTLLTAGIMLVGAIAFNVLPVSPLPQVDFPTISVSASLPGGSPEIMRIFHCNPAGAPVQPHRRRNRDDLVEFAWQHLDHSAIRSEPRHRRRGARRGGSHQRRAHLPARKPALPTRLIAR